MAFDVNELSKKRGQIRQSHPEGKYAEIESKGGYGNRVNAR